MNGGILQLVTVGKEDTVLIKDPEIFHFKKVYLPYSKFSIDNNQHNIGRKNFDSEFDIIINKDGDLLKDVMFYVDIPYFEILKTVKKETSVFTRNQSDKIYYNTEGMKSILYYSGENKFYVIPENIFYLADDMHEKTNFFSDTILSINSEEYSKYFNEKSKFKKISFQSKRNKAVNHLRTIDSYWFNNFIEKVNAENKIVLMDFKKFTNWLNSKMENRMFFDYHSIFNNNDNNEFYQINFFSDRNINELKKYFEILERLQNLSRSNYSDENLDLDKTILYLLNDNKILSENNDYLLNSFVYSSRNILLSLKKLYDDSFNNFHTMFKMFTISTETNNEVKAVNTKVYDISTWKKYTQKYVDFCYDDIELDNLNSFFIDNYKRTLNVIENQLELLWNNLDLKIDNQFNVNFIFSIIYTFITRYNNFNNFDSVNFLDFFEKSGENTFIVELKKNLNNYDDVNTINLENINVSYGNNLDLNIIYNYIFYTLTENIKKLNKFDTFTNISKQNIQFIYWWRNKFSNMIFLRYMRIKNNQTKENDNYYPDFNSFKETQELINFFYTYIPNQSISIQESTDELRRLFYKQSYLGNYGAENIDTSKYMVIEKINLIKNLAFDENITSIIKGQFRINISLSEYLFVNGVIRFNDNCKILQNYFDDKYQLIIKYNSKTYYTLFGYVDSRLLIKVHGLNSMTTDFEIIVIYKEHSNKYYFDYTPFQITKSDFVFESDNITFTTSKHIDTDKFNFTLESEISSVKSYIDITNVTTEDLTNSYNFTIDTDSYLETELFTTTYSNYSTNLYERIEYTNGTETNFEIKSVTVDGILKNQLNILNETTDYFVLSTSSFYYVEYESNIYPITLTGSDNTFLVTGLEIGFLDDETNMTSYRIIEEQLKITNLGQLEFVNTLVEYDVSDSDNDKIFEYTGTDDISGNQILKYDNKYYSVNITVHDLPNNKYQINTFSDFNVDGSTLIFNNPIKFSNTLVLTTSTEYLITFKSIIDTTVTKPITIVEDLSGFDSTTELFKYKLLTNIDDDYNNLIESDSFNFTINGTLKFEEKYAVYSDYVNRLINYDSVQFNFVDGNFYYFDVKYSSGNLIRYNISFQESRNQNNIFFRKNNNSTHINTYEINMNLDLDNIDTLDIIEVIPYYDKFDMLGIIDEDKDNVKSREYFMFDLSNNSENYYRYINNYLGSYYIIYNDEIVYLSSPDVDLDTNKVKFNICNAEKIEIDSIPKSYTVYSLNNNYLPNLINYTSFYPQETSNKVYDLMDYFIQTPMIIYMDSKDAKNGHIILNNLNINIDVFDSIDYFTLDNNNLFLTDKINSNQLLRFEGNLISSSFDMDTFHTYDNINLIRENLIKSIDEKITNILGNDNIGKIIETLERTDILLKSIDLENSISNIQDGTYGLTSKKILETFGNSNISEFVGIDETFDNELTNKYSENNYNIFNQPTCKDYNYYSKLVIDFHGSNINNNNSIDSGLNLSMSLGEGKDLFYVNYEILKNEPKLNSYMLNFLYNYKIEIDNQINYIERNKLWLSLYSKSSKSDFNTFIKFQQDYKNMIYDNNSSEYCYLISNNNLVSDNKVTKFDEKYYINKKEVTIDYENKKIKTTDEIDPINETIDSKIIETEKINYSFDSNKFNYLGPCLILNNELYNVNLELSLDTNKNYMFVDDNSNCRVVISSTTDSFMINDKINRYFKNGIIYEIINQSISPFNQEDLFLYVFENTTDTLSNNDFLLIDNNITMVVDTSMNGNNIGIISRKELKIENAQYFKGIKKTTSDTSENILNYNLLNMIEFNQNKFDLGELLDIKHFNYSVEADQSYNLCTLEDGVLEFLKINTKSYTYINGTIIYTLGSKSLENKPLILNNGTVTYNLNRLDSRNKVFYNGIEVFNIKDKADSTIPEDLWIFNDDINNILQEYNVSLDLSNQEIELDTNIYDNLEEIFFYYNENYYKIGDFTRINKTSDNFEKIYLLNNCFKTMKKFYTINNIPLTSVKYYKMTNSYEITNLNEKVINSTNYRYKLDGTSETNRKLFLLMENKISNNLVSRPINITIPNTTNIFKKLYYSTYKNFDGSNFTNELDSVIKLDVTTPVTGSTLGTDHLFYINFNEFTSGDTKSTINNVVEEYRYFKDLVSKLEINNSNEFITVEYESGMNIFKVTIDEDYKYVVGMFKEIIFDVTFVFENIEITFPIIYHLLVDDDYDVKLQYNNNGTNMCLSEPLTIFGSNDQLFDASYNFHDSIPPVFVNDSGIAKVEEEILDNLTITDKLYKFMDYDDTKYTDGTIKIVKASPNYNKNDFYWEMLDYAIINNNFITNFETFNPIIDKLSNLIIRKGDTLRFVELFKIGTQIFIDYNFYETFVGTIFANLNTVTSIKQKIFINKETNILNTSFGNLDYGDIIKLGNLVVFIKSYSEEFMGYNFDIINNISTYKTSYDSFIHMGSLNNYSKKNDMVNLDKVNNLSIKNNLNTIEGDIIFNNSFSGFYNSSMTDVLINSKTLGFIVPQETLYLFKFNNIWYHFGNAISTGDYVKSDHNLNGTIESKIFKIKSIVNNIIEWDENYDIFFDKLVNTNKDAFIFYKPYLPLKLKSKNSLPNNGIIKIDDSFHIIRDKRIVSNKKTLEDELYYVIDIDFDKFEYADVTNKIFDSNTFYFKNRKLFYNEDIFFRENDSSDIELASRELESTKEFYYKNNTTYNYPIYLIKSSNLQKRALTSDNIEYFYYDTTLTSSLTEPSNITDIYDYVHNPVYVKIGTKYSFPLFLSNQFLLNDSLISINEFQNLELNVNIENKTSAIKFTSTPNITAVKDIDYSYTIVTEPVDCSINVRNLPLWLSISGNSITGRPTINDLSDNIVELIASKDAKSIIQKFYIDIKNDVSDFQITSTPSTHAFTKINYEFDIVASDTINSIKTLYKPSWLDISNNKLIGQPDTNAIGLNDILLEVCDSSDNVGILNYNIFVQNKNPIFCNTNPPTILDSSNNYLYDLSINNLDNDNYTITSNLPNWLTLTDLRLETNGNAIDFTDNKVEITITHNDSSDIKNVHNYEINDISDIYVTSLPKTFVKYNSYYEYTLLTNKLNFTSVLMKAPDWLELNENNIISGNPSYGDTSEEIIVKVFDHSGNFGLQTFTIDILEINDKVIKLMNGFKEVNSNIKPFHKVILNKTTMICKNLIDFGDYFDLLTLEDYDFSGNSELIVPTNKSKIENNFINGKPVEIIKDYLNYRLEISTQVEESNLYCYYIENDQKQLVLFKCNIINNGNFTTNDTNFENFYNTYKEYDLEIFIENYVKIEIVKTDATSVEYLVTPFLISDNNSVLIEERNKDNVNIFNCNLSLENGLLKIDVDIENSESDFFLNRIIPIRIRNKVIQLLDPIITRNFSIGVLDEKHVDQWLKIPIKKTTKPTLTNNKWRIEIKSDFINLILKNNLYSKISYDQKYSVYFIKEDDKFYLEYNNIPNTLENFVYLKEVLYFKNLIKFNDTWKSNSQLTTSVPDDKTLETFITENWKLGYTFTKIPVNLVESDSNNTFKVTNFNQINLNSENVSYYLNNMSNNIIEFGINNNSELEITTENNISTNQLNKAFIFYEVVTNEITRNNISEPYTTVKSKINEMMVKNDNTKILFNVAKPLIDWTSITFHKIANYKSINQTFEKYMHVDSSGIVEFKNDIKDCIVLYEEIKQNSEFINVGKKLVDNNFENYNLLIEIRKIEILIYNYINNESLNKLFWIDPIQNINNYLGSKTFTKDYLIYKNCLIHKDEVQFTSDITKFKIIDNDSIERICYLDNQFNIVKNDTNLLIFRNINQVQNSIENFFNKNTNSYFGVNSHKLLRYISKMYYDKNRYLDDLCNGIDFNFNYELLTAEKIIITKQWEYIKNDLRYNKILGKEFNDKLEIVNKIIPNLRYNGITINSNYNIQTFGFSSFNKINFLNLTDENVIFNDFVLEEKVFDSNITYKLESEHIFRYLIEASENVLFNPEYKYILNMLEGENIFSEEIIDITKYDANHLEFTSSIDFNEVNRLTLDIIKDYDIIKTDFLGYIYDNVLISNLNTSIFDLYYDDLTLDTNNIKLDISGVSLNLSSTTKILNHNFLRLEKLVGIKSQNLDGNKLVINFSKIFLDSNIENIVDEIYIKIDSIPYLINKDNNEYFITIDKHIDLKNNFIIFGYLNINDIESKLTNKLNYRLQLDETLDNVMFKTKSPLIVNYSIDNNNILDLKFVSDFMVNINTTFTLDNPKLLNSTFSLEKDDMIYISDIERNTLPFLIKINNTTKILDNNSIKLTNGTDDISGSIFKNVNNEYILFNTSEKIDIFEIVDYYTQIENIKSITDFTFSDNKLKFEIIENITFILSEEFSYYIDVSGSYMQIDNSNISLENQFIELDLTNYGITNVDSPFNFKQIDYQIKEYHSSEYNFLANIEIKHPRKSNTGDKFFMNYLTIQNKEIGNYIYKVTDDDSTYSWNNLLYALSFDKNKILEAVYIEKREDFVYFATKEEIEYGLNKIVSENSFTFDLSRALSNIFFITYNLTEGIVDRVIDDNNNSVILNTREHDNIYELFPNTDINLYISFYNKGAYLDLKYNSSIQYTFPKELKYENYIIKNVETKNIVEKVEWKDEANFDVFKNIDFYLDDIKIDSFNKNIFKISNLYMENKKDLEIKPYQVGDNIRFFIPTQFWFSKNSSSYLPLIALENTIIKIKFKMNDLKNLIENDLEDLTSSLPNNALISVLTDTILLDNEERRNFAEYNHEYIIERFVSYNDNILKNTNERIQLPIKGLVKDIFWITTSPKTQKNYISDTEIDRDDLYIEFLDVVEKYKIYVSNNFEFSNDVPTSYIDKILDYEKVIEIINYDSTGLVEGIKNNETLSKYEIKFILYIYFDKLKYYDLFDDSQFSSDPTKANIFRINHKLNKIINYLANVHKNTIKVNELDPIKSIEFKANGQNILERQTNIFFNCLTTMKLEKTPSKGIYYYSFSLFPKSEQPSGHLNFNLLKDPILNLELDPKIVDENMFLNTVIKEYTILRIIGGMSSLSWN